jgi:hypothetical protein
MLRPEITPVVCLWCSADPTVPMFKDWLNHLGGGEYAAKFIEAGYDLAFIAKHGVTGQDLDCVGIPTSKMGLRRKIMQLHELSQFYSADEDDEEGEEEEEDEVSCGCSMRLCWLSNGWFWLSLTMIWLMCRRRKTKRIRGWWPAKRPRRNCKVFPASHQTRPQYLRKPALDSVCTTF